MDVCRVTASRRPAGNLLIAALAIGIVMTLEGCLAGAWLAAVGIDSMRSSNVTFSPFERSWVSTENAREMPTGPLLTSVAVPPIEGDAQMGPRLIQTLEQQTALRVDASVPHEGLRLGLLQGGERRAEVAKGLSRELAVDAVLLGRVAAADAHPSDWGWKNEEQRRLYLYLVDRDGHTLWTDELPFTIVTGSKPPIEDRIQAALDRHFTDHVKELRLDDLGYFPLKNS